MPGTSGDADVAPGMGSMEMHKASLELDGSWNDEQKEETKPLSMMDTARIVLGIYAFFLMYGISQEHIFNVGDEDDQYTYGNFLIFCVAFANLIFSLTSMLLYKGTSETMKELHSLDHDMLAGMAQVALTSTIAMISTASALAYVNLPLQVLMKSAKSVPVMVGNLLRGKRYPWYDHAAVILITGSLIVFNLAKPSKKGGQDSSTFGIALLCLSLFMDGLTGPKQDVIVKQYNLSPNKLMLVQNAFSSCFAFVMWVSFDGLFAPIQFLNRHPEGVQWIALYCLCGMGGQHCIYQAVVNFGSLHLTLITTVRKFFTVLLSVVIFGHSLTFWQSMAVGGIFSAISLQTVAKNAAKKKALKTE